MSGRSQSTDHLPAHTGSLRLGGAHTSITALLRLRHLGRLLTPFAKGGSRHAMTGGRQSKFRGRGVDFSEVRAYQPGDDVRAIDWRVTARRGRTHTKVYREERERPVLVLVDQRRSMHFGSRDRFKAVAAAELAGLLAWSTVAGGDRVGGLVFNEDGHHAQRPTRGPRSAVALLSAIHRSNTNPASSSHASLPAGNPTTAGLNLAGALLQLRRVARPGSLVFVLSDFQDPGADWTDQLSHLSRHNDLACLFLHDSLEQELPPPGLYAISNGDQQLRIDASSSDLRRQHRQAFAARLDHCAEQCRRQGAAFLPVATQQDGLAALAQLP